MENQLTPQEQLQAQIEAYYHTKYKKMCNEFLHKLRQIEGFMLSPNTACKSLSNNQVGLCVIDEENNILFASEVTLYANSPNFGGSVNRIGYGSTGAFAPNDNEGSYWRTIHAGECLKNWEKVCEIVNQTCQEYADLCKLLDDLQSDDVEPYDD